MFRQRLQAETNFPLTQQDNLERNERAYKLVGAERTRTHLQTLLDGTLPGRMNVQIDLNRLVWQLTEGLNTRAKERPGAFRAALTTLWACPLNPAPADAFWSALDPAPDVLSDMQRQHFSGSGTRASVASSFLFLADPLNHPFFRPNFAGRAVEWLDDKREGLDRCTLGSLMVDFVGRCRYLHREFTDAGVALRDMLDLQGARTLKKLPYERE